MLWPFFRKRQPFFFRLYLWAGLGYASHGLLDACTSYGTYLLWPLTEARYAWNWISVIDPVYSVPLAILLAVSVWRRSRCSLVLAWIWLVAYMSLGAVQKLSRRAYRGRLGPRDRYHGRASRGQTGIRQPDPVARAGR